MLLRFLVVLTFLLSARVYGQNEKLVLVRQQNETKDTLLCVSSDVEKAIVWDTPISDEYVENIEVSYPNTEPQTIQWEKQNSIKNFYGPILDSRWESFPTDVTDGQTLKYGYINFFKLKQINEFSKFDIPVSVRVKDNAHIYVCTNSEKPPENECYWFILGGFKDKRSILRKCKNGEISKKDQQPSGNCKISVVQNYRQFLTESEYVHFVIKFDNESKTISLVILGETVPLLNYFEKNYDETQTYKSVWASSRSDKGLKGFWKIHSYDYYFNRGFESKEVISKYRSNFCLSMYAALCQNCTLELTLKWSTTVKKMDYFYNKVTPWQRIQLNVTGSEGFYTLYAKITASESVNPMLAIDKIEFSSNCFDNEVKYSTLELKPGVLNKATCKFLTSDGQITTNPVGKVTDTDLTCPLETIGPKCIPCIDLPNNCRYSQICQYHQNNEICYCSAGYTSDRCANQCPENTYGLNCNHKCGHCKNVPCDFVTGVCKGDCQNNYEGKYCNETMYPIILHAPTLRGDCYTLCKFDVKPGEYVGKFLPNYYEIHYKISTTDFWMSGDKKNSSETEFDIDGLNLSTNYTVIVVLCTADGHCLTDNIPELQFSTICLELRDDDISVKTGKYSVDVEIRDYNNTENCQTKEYNLRVYNGIGKALYNKELIKLNSITGLGSYKSYYFSIINRRSKYSINSTFSTDESENSKVTGVGFNSTSSDIFIYWKEPIHRNGLIIAYDVYIKHQSYKQCNFKGNNSVQFRKNVTDTNVTFTNLAPYSSYEVTITAYNNYPGEAYTLKVETQSSEVLVPEAYNLFGKAGTIDLIVGVATDCTRLFSDFWVHVLVYCSETYCTKYKNITLNANNLNQKITGLAPFTEYKMLATIENSFKKSLTLPVITSKTLADVPNAVNNFDYYGISGDRILFRFNPPYPPTGELQVYNIMVTKKIYIGSYYYNKQYTPSPCQIWPRMHCITVEALDSNTNYWFKIEAKNQNITTWSHPLQTPWILTWAGRPEPPTNILVLWDNSNNAVLQWQHPNKMNGILKSFTIYLDKKRYTVPIYESQYNLTYTCTITFTSEYADTESISINSVNEDGQFSGYSSVTVDTPPPIPEFKDSPTIIMKTNQTVFVNVPKVIKLGGNSWLYIIVTKMKSDGDPEASPSQMKLINDWILPHPDLSAWIAGEYKLLPKRIEVVVGDGKITFVKRIDDTIFNWAIQPGTKFKIYLVALNERKTFIRHKSYTLNAETTKDELSSDFVAMDIDVNAAVYLCLLLLLVPIILFIFYAKKKKIRFAILRNPTTISSTTMIVHDSIPLRNTLSDMPSQQSVVLEESKIPSKYSRRVNLADFEEYVKESISNGVLAKQHELFLKGEQKPNDYGKVPENRSKNRYINLVSYNHTRVKLAKVSGDCFSDYINANYINGLNCSKAYIATQGPKPNTLDDFWRMVWQEKVAHIVMLANVFENGKKKTEKYWPNYNEDVNYGEINVRHISTEVFADYEIRNFAISQNDEERKIEQLHFNTWPDHGVPVYPQNLVPLVRKILTYPHGSAPIIIHCSAGVGRTGTIILIDLCLRMAAKTGNVDVLYHQYKLREQRTNMVDNLDQYKLAHLVILECLFSPVTTIRCDEHFEEAMKKIIEKDLQTQMEYIERSAWQENAISGGGIINRKEYPEKDRYPGNPVETYGVVYLPPYPHSDESSTYINAAAVDGFRSPVRFISTQNPLPNTVGDFWRLVVDNDVSIIVSLQTIDVKDPSCCQFLPSKKLKVVNATPIIAVHHVQSENLEMFEMVSVSVHYKEEQRKIKIIELKEWNKDEQCVPNKNALLAVWQQMNQLSWNENKVVVTCRDGISACGLYLAMCFTLEKINFEQMCDVCHAVRVIRRSRRQFVQSEEQFVALHKIVHLYLTHFELYSNFVSRQ